MFKIRCLTQSKSGYDSLFQSIIRHTSVPTAIHMLIVSILLFRPDCFVLHKNNKFHSDLDYKFEVRTSVNTGTIVYRYLSPNEFHLTEYRCRRETSYLFFFCPNISRRQVSRCTLDSVEPKQCIGIFKKSILFLSVLLVLR